MDLKLAEIKAKVLMIEHGLIQKGWKFQFNNRRHHLGLCSHYRKIIYLSKYYVLKNNWEPSMKDTMLHEIAHALVGAGHGHDWHWRNQCRKIGAIPSVRSQDSQLKIPENKYIAACPCGILHGVQRRGKHFNNYRCSRCKAKLVFSLNPSYGVKV